MARIREQNEKIKQRRLVRPSCVHPSHLHMLHAEYVRTSPQTRTHLNRLRRRNGYDRCKRGRYRKRLIVHGNKVLGESWIRSRVGNGIRIKRQKGGQRMQSLNSLRQSHRTRLHGLIPEMQMRGPKPHRLRNRARGEIADGGQGGVDEGAAEEGGVKPVTELHQQASPRRRRRRRRLRLRK
jgi:hypothetical protein